MGSDKNAKKTESARRRMRAYQAASHAADTIGRGELPIPTPDGNESGHGIRAPQFTGTRRVMRRAYYEARGYVDQKLAENEEDNTGIEAARKSENAAEDALRTVRGTLPSRRAMFRRAQRRLRQRAQRSEEEYHRRLYRQQEAERQRAAEGETNHAQTADRSAAETGSNSAASKTDTKAAASESRKPAPKEVRSATGESATAAVSQSGKQAGENAAKENIKKSAAKNRYDAYRKMMYRRAQKETAKQAAKKGAEAAAAKTAEGVAVAGTAGTVGTVAVNGAGLATGVEEYLLIAVAVVVLVILVIVLIAMIVATILLHSFYSTQVAGAMYLSEPTAIEQAELRMSYLEASLVEYIEDIENKDSGYDGYVLEDSYYVGHNPYTLINYLSARYEEFEYDDVEAEIDDLFNTRYTLVKWVEEVTPESEENTEEEDEDDEDDDDEEEEEEEDNTLYILHIRLDTNDTLENIVADRMSDEQKEQYELYEETHGGFEFIASPIGEDYSNRISSYYGYRYHPISNSLRLHRGLDIAIPEGTDLYAGIDGVVTKVDYDDGGYGNYVIIKNDAGEEVRYAHMSNVSVSVGHRVQKGVTVLGQSGNTGASTGPHVHVEFLENGDYRNPLFYLDTE